MDKQLKAIIRDKIINQQIDRLYENPFSVDDDEVAAIYWEILEDLADKKVVERYGE